MKTWSFFDPHTGLFAGLHYTGSDGTVEANTPRGHASAEGLHDHLSRKVDLATGAVVDYQPPAPSSDHEWNDTTKRWQLTAAAQAKADAAAAARARHAALIVSQHDDIRRAVLGDAAALERLRAIETEVSGLITGA